ncbi:TonB-dependent receptor plug domain-containing protein [Riemerella anatipestifer]|nr:TonB-dependent receptor plug domain-containing protein [Riemerella anatipestifer]MDY3324477.1 TonB-dependent receptor plug domain-containing protein [Riemerella anatipestifer]MDY3353292.1 TonB-dependent receptor plug domain-containing protein [Riemerella anatipestifer]
MRFLFLYILIFPVLSISACTVSIDIQNFSLNYNLKELSVKINSQKQTSNENGIIHFYNVPTGEYTLEIFYDKKVIYIQEIYVDCSKNENYIEISPYNYELDEIVLKGKTEQEKLKESPFSVQVIDLESVKQSVNNIGTLLNQTTGIKLRNNGNVGALSQINLGGMQGKAVRIFKDGMPIELYGHGFDPSMLSPEMLAQITIYKGALPVNLSADALGGGINLQTQIPDKSQLNITTTTGSFGTYKTSLNGILSFKSNGTYFFGTQNNFISSQNNYTVTAPYYNPTTSTNTDIEASRFHDATRNLYTEWYGGVSKKKWAEKFKIGLLFSSFYKEIQHSADMSKVYGEPYAKEKNITQYLQYQNRFLNSDLKIDAHIVHSQFNNELVDLSKKRYDWLGNVVVETSDLGEINRGNHQKLKFDLFHWRTNIAYKFSSSHQLEFGSTWYQQKRVGSDSIGGISPLTRTDILKNPAYYKRNVNALGLTSFWWNNKIETALALKHYQYSAKGFSTDNYGFSWQANHQGRSIGYTAGVSLKEKLFLLKMTYENATRLPDDYELYGDAVLIKENLELKPERSHNINFIVDFTSQNYKWNSNLNLFYRKVTDIIFLQLDIPFNRYINYHNTRILGGEYELTYRPSSQWETGMNITYQDIRSINVEKTMKFLEGSRVPNIPYFFGNHYTRLNFFDIFKKEDRLSFYYHINYVHRFFLKAMSRKVEPSLFDKPQKISTDLLIPNDNRLGMASVDAGISYFFHRPQMSLSLNAYNLTNEKLYDNFRVQKPGRAFYLKIAYHFN